MPSPYCFYFQRLILKSMSVFCTGFCAHGMPVPHRQLSRNPGQLYLIAKIIMFKFLGKEIQEKMVTIQDEVLLFGMDRILKN